MHSLKARFTDEEFLCIYLKENPEYGFDRLLMFVSEYGINELVAYARQQLLPKTICRRLKLAHKTKTKLKRKDHKPNWINDMNQ
jgi:hypothetical protein